MKKLIFKNLLLFFCLILFSCKSRNFDKKRQILVNYLAFCSDRSLDKCTNNCTTDCDDENPKKVQLKRDGVKYVNEPLQRCIRECRENCNKYCNFTILLSQTNK